MVADGGKALCLGIEIFSIIAFVYHSVTLTILLFPIISLYSIIALKNTLICEDSH